MENKKYTIIEIIADYIYFVITGSYIGVNKFIKNLNNNKKYNNRKFLSVRIDIPLAFTIDKLEHKHNIKIIIDEGTESAQSFTIARHSFINSKNDIHEELINKTTYMLIELEENIINSDIIYKLKFPKLDLCDNDDPEEVVLKWVRINGYKVTNIMKKTIKPLSLVGYNEDILVYTAKI